MAIDQWLVRKEVWETDKADLDLDKAVGVRMNGGIDSKCSVTILIGAMKKAAPMCFLSLSLGSQALRGKFRAVKGVRWWDGKMTLIFEFPVDLWEVTRSFGVELRRDVRDGWTMVVEVIKRPCETGRWRHRWGPQGRMVRGGKTRQQAIQATQVWQTEP